MVTNAFRVGDGVPEGQVAAPIGSVYVDRQATAGAVRWIKTQGTGNTGWQVEYGDTGIRNVSALFSGVSGSSNRATLRRVGSTVQLTTRILIIDEGVEPWTVFFNLPTGFRPAKQIRFLGSLPTVEEYEANPNGTVTTTNQSIAPNGLMSFHLLFLTNDSWPSTRPGTPS